jgi:hypothetical protein
MYEIIILFRKKCHFPFLPYSYASNLSKQGNTINPIIVTDAIPECVRTQLQHQSLCLSTYITYNSQNEYINPRCICPSVHSSIFLIIFENKSEICHLWSQPAWLIYARGQLTANIDIISCFCAYHNCMLRYWTSNCNDHCMTLLKTFKNEYVSRFINLLYILFVSFCCCSSPSKLPESYSSSF